MKVSDADIQKAAEMLARGGRLGMNPNTYAIHGYRFEEEFMRPVITSKAIPDGVVLIIDKDASVVDRIGFIKEDKQ